MWYPNNKTQTRKIHMRIKNNNTTKSQNNKITNWHNYGLSLGKRGSFIALIEIAEKQGAFNVPSRTYCPGRPRKYSDELIVLILIFHELYRLPLRQSTRFTFEVMMSLGKFVPLPDYSTISRRASELNINILPDDYCLHATPSIDLLVDSSGFYVHGEGNWFRRKHGMHSHRMWQETHIATDYGSRMVLAVIDTPNNVHDNTQLLPLIIDTEKTLKRSGISQNLNSIIGDGAYEANKNYHLARQLHTTFIAPPHKNATYRYSLKDGHLIDVPGYEDRNKVIRAIVRAGDPEQWKKDVGYHRRSLVENTFYRLKTIFGDKMLMRSNKNRHTEQLVRVMILNLFTSYGLPKYN